MRYSKESLGGRLFITWAFFTLPCCEIKRTKQTYFPNVPATKSLPCWLHWGLSFLRPSQQNTETFLNKQINHWSIMRAITSHLNAVLQEGILSCLSKMRDNTVGVFVGAESLFSLWNAVSGKKILSPNFPKVKTDLRQSLFISSLWMWNVSPTST